MDGCDVLIVEDDRRLSEILARALERRGHPVRLAGSVAAARAALNQARPSVLLLDIDLPDGTGWELLREGDAVSAPTRVIVMSAGQPARRRMEQFHPFCFLSKPFAIDTLLGLIEQAEVESATGNDGLAASGTDG
jgi:two-component system nitrogen regulation response regulator GlnG